MTRAEIDQVQSDDDTWDPDLAALLQTIDPVLLDQRLRSGLCPKCGLRPSQEDFWACAECDPESVENQEPDGEEDYDLDEDWENDPPKCSVCLDLGYTGPFENRKLCDCETGRELAIAESTRDD